MDNNNFPIIENWLKSSFPKEADYKKIIEYLSIKVKGQKLTFNLHIEAKILEEKRKFYCMSSFLSNYNPMYLHDVIGGKVFFIEMQPLIRTLSAGAEFEIEAFKKYLLDK